jgi:hypothetical protein
VPIALLYRLRFIVETMQWSGASTDLPDGGFSEILVNPFRQKYFAFSE